MSVQIRLATKEDYSATEQLVRCAFWNVYRPGCTEHYVLHCFRQSPQPSPFVPELDLVLQKDNTLIGQIIFVRSQIFLDDGGILPCMTFGPLCIQPEYQRQGYGMQLLSASMQKAKAMGSKVLAITGDINFYGKAGFVLGSSKGIRYLEADSEDSVVPYFLVAELEPDALSNKKGSYQDPEGYFVAESNPQGFADFDAHFPPKEKCRLSGQLQP